MENNCLNLKTMEEIKGKIEFDYINFKANLFYEKMTTIIFKLQYTVTLLLI